LGVGRKRKMGLETALAGGDFAAGTGGEDKVRVKRRWEVVHDRNVPFLLGGGMVKILTLA